MDFIICLVAQEFGNVDIFVIFRVRYLEDFRSRARALLEVVLWTVALIKYFLNVVIRLAHARKNVRTGQYLNITKRKILPFCQINVS